MQTGRYCQKATVGCRLRRNREGKKKKKKKKRKRRKKKKKRKRRYLEPSSPACRPHAVATRGSPVSRRRPRAIFLPTRMSCKHLWGTSVCNGPLSFVCNLSEFVISSDVICIWLMKCLLEQLLVDPVGIASSGPFSLL
ncbi:hypothetical protein BHE74_00038691 [Ensete ventricosum]|nr:hypothetical protein BHE74_00038691 [Ensete ventricosum]